MVVLASISQEISHHQIKAIISVAVLLFLIYIIQHSSTTKGIAQNVEFSAARGYIYCGVDPAQVASFEKNYPCDFSPQSNPSKVTVVIFINSACMGSIMEKLDTIGGESWNQRQPLPCWI